jgi:hypothetical protein
MTERIADLEHRLKTSEEKLSPRFVRPQFDEDVIALQEEFFFLFRNFIIIFVFFCLGRVDIRRKWINC